MTVCSWSLVMGCKSLCKTSTHSSSLNLSNARLVVTQVANFPMTKNLGELQNFTHHQVKLRFCLHWHPSSVVGLWIHHYQRNHLVCILHCTISSFCTCVCKIKAHCGNLTAFHRTISGLPVLTTSVGNASCTPVLEWHVGEIVELLLLWWRLRQMLRFWKALLRCLCLSCCS